MPEFQVIVFAAGKGSRITELTSKKTKCLLPVGNLPMLYYPLKLIEMSDFKEVYLVVTESSKSEIEFALEKTDLTINIVMITVPCDTDWGTADSLRHISPYVISDFILVSCDLFTVFDIKKVINFHRKNGAALTALYFKPASDIYFTNPGTKSKNKTERDLIVVDPLSSRLVFLASASDYEELVPLKIKLLQKYGAVQIYTKLLDAHFFVMKKWVIKYLTREKNLSTVKGELIPTILKREVANENKFYNICNSGADVTPVKDFTSDKSDLDIYALAKNIDSDTSTRSMSSYNDHDGDLFSVYLNDYIRSYAFVAIDAFGIRNNTLHDFCKSNRAIMRYWSRIVKNPSSNISSAAEIESTQLEKETCFVDALTKIASKTSIKTSSIGRSCVIESKTRISDCIIMNNVIIKEGCVLHNCIICDDVIIEPGCNIKDSVIGSAHTVPANSVHANDVIAEIESLMEI